MIIIKVELHSAITGKITQLARMHIANTGKKRGPKFDYTFATFRGRDERALSRLTVQHEGGITDYASDRYHVWNLVAKALNVLGYGFDGAHTTEGAGRPDIRAAEQYNVGILDAGGG